MSKVEALEVALPYNENSKTANTKSYLILNTALSESNEN